MARVSVTYILVLLAVSLDWETVICQSQTINQLKLEFDKIDKRLCTEPLPKEQQLEKLDDCSPLTKLVGKEAVMKCRVEAHKDAKNREEVLVKYCAIPAQDRPQVDKAVYDCIIGVAEANPSPEFKETMEKKKAFETMDDDRKKEEGAKRVPETEKRLKEVLQCEKSALEMTS